MRSIQTLTVTTPILAVVGSVALIGGLVAGWLAWNGSWLGPFVCVAMFGGCGAALLLMAARISGDDSRISVERLFSRHTANWAAISGFEVGGGNLVFRLDPGGRLVVPGFEFWSGRDKNSLILLIGAKLTERGVKVKGSVRAFISAGDRK